MASWLGITAKERSSGEKRRLGAISEQGDVYLAPNKFTVLDLCC
jgi:transposase